MTGIGGRLPGAGRPKGSKNLLGEAERKRIARVVESLTKSGKGLLQFALERPEMFWTRIYTKIIPQNVEVGLDGILNVRAITELSDAELSAIAARGRPRIAKKAGRPGKAD